MESLKTNQNLSIILARECLYRLLAAALSDPLNVALWRLLEDLENQRLAREAVEMLRDEARLCPPEPGCGELPLDHLDLEAFLQALPGRREQACTEYDRVFGLVPSRECPPYEVEYHASGEAFFRTQQLADIAGFYRAFGLEISQTTPMRPDHIVLELEFMALVLMKERQARMEPDDDERRDERLIVCEEAGQSFFRDHLAWWVPSFSLGLRRRAREGFYHAVGQLLAALWPLERDRYGIPPPRLPLQVQLIEKPEEQGGCVG